MPVTPPCRSCNALLTDGFQGDADPFSLYSLQGPAYSFVANCPPGFDCSNAPYLLLNCCGEAIMVNLIGVTGAQRTQAINDAMARCLRSWQYCGQVPVIPPNRPGNPKDPPVQVFYNAPQFCSYTCPDGIPYSQGTAAGTVAGLSQEEANAAALNRMCQQAASAYFCLTGTPSPVSCLGSPYSATLIITGVNPGPFSASVIGQLPTGLNLSQSHSEIYITGTPSAVGDFAFNIKVDAPRGGTITKHYTISIMGVTSPATCPAAQTNVDYSQQLTASGGQAPYLWRVVQGSIPPGLTLSSLGLLDGAVTYGNGGDYAFTVQAMDQTGAACTLAMTMHVTDPAGPDWSQLVWDAYTLVQQPPNTAFGSAHGWKAIGSLSKDAGSFFPGINPAHSSLVYSGGIANCRMTLVVSTLTGFGNVTFRFHQNGFQLGSLNVSAAGTYTHDFVIAAGAGSSLVIDGAPDCAQLYSDGTPGTLAFTMTIRNI